MSKKKLYLLDGMALSYRAHFAFINSRLKNSEGIPTGPILGFANTLVKLLEEDKPTHIAVVWDTQEPTFRHKMDEDYKANRPPQPEDLRTGIPLIKEMVEKFGIQNLEQDGYEADDIIGTIASNANADDVNVFLVTPDKDFMQLVHDHITMVKPDNKNGGFNFIDREGVKDYFSVYPEQVVDVLALIGDSSDNVPGVPGIGKKGAPDLINEYGSIENAIEHADEIKSKRQREGLNNYADQARHAKKMVTIKTDVPDTVTWAELEWEGPEKKELGLFFKRMEFKTLTKKYLGIEPGGQSDLFTSSEDSGNGFESLHDTYDEKKTEYALVNDKESVEKIVERLRKTDAFCFDTETDDKDPVTANLVGISLSVQKGEAWYIPVNVEGAMDQSEVCKLLQAPFEDKGKLKIAHNLKFDYLLLKRAGLEMKEPVFDTMVAAYLLDANQKLKMDFLAKKYLDYEPIPIDKLIGTGKKQKSMAEIPFTEIKDYACEDADVTLQLWQVLKDELEKDELLDIASKVDFPLITVLGDMELNGIKIDAGLLKEFSEELEKDLEETEQKVFEEAGEKFNINSPQQLGKILFEKLEIPSSKKTKTGQYSTAENVLTELANEYKVPGLVLDYRSLSKLKSTYVDALPKLINKDTGRVHTNFNQTVAATGRLSSSNPNLQNIPIRTERGREIRKAFVPDSGFKLMSADYSQVELRVIASIAEDEAMIRAFENDEDIHSRTAMEVFGIDLAEEVTPDHRRKAKEVNFGIPYGVSAYGLSSRLGISNSEGKEMIDQYFERFPGIKSYIDETIEYAKKHGYVKTVMGRRRYIPDINSRNWNIRGFAERIAINMPIQGTAADIIKIAMNNIHSWLLQNNLKSRMLLQVHDELVFEIHEDETGHVPDKITDMMEQAFELKVPLKVETGLADNWLQAH